MFAQMAAFDELHKFLRWLQQCLVNLLNGKKLDNRKAIAGDTARRSNNSSFTV
jgi:hypothetical protein